MSQFVRDRAYLNSLGFSSSSYYIRWHCVILHTHTQGTPILPSSFCFLFDFFSHLNFKLKFEKNTKVFVRFLLQNDRSQRVVSEMNRPRLTEAAHSKFFFFFPFLFVLQVLNRAHLSPPHSYSLLVDINNRPTLDFSFFFRGSFLFIYFRLVWLSHVVFLSLLFLVQRLPELTTMNRYIFLSVFIYIYIILGCWAGCWAATDRYHRSPPPHLHLVFQLRRSLPIYPPRLLVTLLFHSSSSCALPCVPYNKTVTLTRSDITRREPREIISRLLKSINIRHVPLSLLRCSSFPRACILIPIWFFNSPKLGSLLSPSFDPKEKVQNWWTIYLRLSKTVQKKEKKKKKRRKEEAEEKLAGRSGAAVSGFLIKNIWSADGYQTDTFVPLSLSPSSLPSSLYETRTFRSFFFPLPCVCDDNQNK